jgi:glucokinase-like ROK family protein
MGVMERHTSKTASRQAVVHAIRKHGPVSQARICRETGLSPSTVLRMARDLITEGLVSEMGMGRSNGGRRPVLLNFNPTAGHVVGVDLGGSHMAGAVADLSGDVLHLASRPTPAADGPEAVLAALYDTIAAVCRAAGVPSGRLRAIGVGVPGVTRAGSGTVVQAPALGWRDVSLRVLLEERFGARAIVENDANMIALGELWFGAAQGARHVLTIVIGTGIGAGVIIDGDLYRGARDAAGEIGFTVFDREFLGIPYREFGCLETFAAGPGIAKRAQERLSVDGFAPGWHKAADGNGVRTEHVFAAAAAGDEVARQIVNETADALAVAIVNASALLDPDVVVLGGGVMRSGELLLGRIVERTTAALITPPPVVLSQLGSEATVMGAIAGALAAEEEWAAAPMRGTRRA